MLIKTHIKDKKAVVRFVNGSGAFRPLAELERVLSLDVTSITVDLKDVSFIDSMGLGELVAFHASAMQADVHMKLINANPDVRRFLDLANVGEILDVQGPESPPNLKRSVATTLRVGTGHSSRVFEARLGEHEERLTLILIVEGVEVPMSPGKAKLSRLELLEATDEERRALHSAGYLGSLRFL
jgi:anti-anti-sigma factor